ncbi:MAG: 50S ribosomal protein L31e [Methanosarcinales archaeon]
MEKDVIKEHVYTIPLRAVKKVPRWKRSKRAIKEIRTYLAKHTKSDYEDIKLDKSLNEKIWERGAQKPPSKIRVRAVKFEDGIVEAELASE